MKKVVRMLGLCALVALAFTACKKNQTNSNLTFKAVINQPTSADRTFINDANALAWNEGDEIKVVNLVGVEKDFTVGTIGDVTTYKDNNGTFEVADADADFMSNLTDEKNYAAFYHVTDIVKSGDATETVKIEIPQVQTRRSGATGGGSFMSNTYPMYATNGGVDQYGDPVDNDVFFFRSDAGVLRLMFKDAIDNHNVIHSIQITSTDPLVGTMVYPIAYPINPSYSYEANVENEKYSVTLNCPGGVELDAENLAVFEIVLLKNALASGFTITIMGADEAVIDTYNVPAMNKNKIAAETITIMNPTVIPFPFAH